MNGDELNQRVKIYIAPSSIHGVGVFALKDIKKDEKVYVNYSPQAYTLSQDDIDKLLPEVKQLLLQRWPQMIDNNLFLYPDAIFQAYMNHSLSPNYDCLHDIALKDIKKDEEITENYRDIKGWNKVYSWL